MKIICNLLLFHLVYGKSIEPNYKVKVEVPLCLQGWSNIGDKCYWISEGKENFDQAVEKCKDLNSKLFEPRSKTEDDGVFDHIKARFSQNANQYFIGIQKTPEEKT